MKGKDMGSFLQSNLKIKGTRLKENRLKHWISKVQRGTAKDGGGTDVFGS